MNTATNFNIPLPLNILVFTILVVFTLFIWQGNKGFSLADESFLWYGVQRVMLGDVPIRDFMSYDPGRYYWSAAFMGLWGDNGIMSLRVAVAIFQTLGLFLGLLLIARSVNSFNFQTLVFVLLSTIILVAWMYPRHKLFDISLSILLIGTLTYLIGHPSNRRYFVAGLCLGLIAVFGRNHGAYGLAGSLGVLAWLKFKRTESQSLTAGLWYWGLGVFMGYSPILITSLFVSGYANAFWESIRFQLERGGTNLFLPIPWPWRANFGLPFGEVVRGVLIGLFFIGTIMFGVLAILWVFWQKFQKKPVPPALVASAFLALPYAHYAHSRADVGHLAHGIFPLLVGCLVVLASKSSKIRLPLTLLLCITSIWVMLPLHPGWQCRTDNSCENVEISGNNLEVSPGTASSIALLRELTAEYAPDNESVVVTPLWPGAYPILEKESPMWASYALWRRSDAFQHKEIDRIKRFDPAYVLILDYALDGKDSLRFKHTNKLIYQYVTDNFCLRPKNPDGLFVYLKNDGAGLCP